MANLSIKNIPDKLYEELKNRAEQNQRSLNKEIIYSLQTAISMPRDRDINKILLAAEKLRNKAKFRISDKELNKAKNWGRS